MGREKPIADRLVVNLNNLPYCIAENIMGTNASKDRPDINGCYKGRSFRIEVKSEDTGYKQSAGQSMDIKRWKKAGCIAVIAKTWQEVLEKVIYKIDKEVG